MFLETKSDKINMLKTLEDFVINGSVNVPEALLKNPEFQFSVPLLNCTPLHELKDTCLVRFRGMIQDMLDPEIYLEKYVVKLPRNETRIQEGKYRDCLVLRTGEEVDHNANNNVHGERRTLFVVSLPGQNKWAKEHEEKCNRSSVVSKENLGSGSYGIQKRPAAMEDETENSMERLTSNNEKSNKRLCVEPEKAEIEALNAGKLLGADFLLNSPIPQRPSKACIVKIYDDFDSYILNELVDIIGFLSVDPSLDASTIDPSDCQDLNNASELLAQNPPPSLIPRLHAVVVRKLVHANPLLDSSLQQPDAPSVELLNMMSVQKDLRMLLTLCLFNDDLAAEYVLSHLISTVYSRAEMQTIGKFALNICNLPKDCLQFYTQKFYEILELLLPASHYLPLTLETMNTVSFAPKKDYETNKLVSGLLQLAPHTHLVLDETRLEQGKLEPNGVMGVQHLAHLINNQQLKCDFQYYQIDFNVDIPVLLLSEGRSMLPSDFVVPVHADAESIQLVEETLKAARHYLHSTRLDQFRRFLTNARTSSFNMKSEHMNLIQNDFVEMRKQNALSTGDDLHALLVLTRLLAIARGKDSFDEETWQLAKTFEIKRQQRIKDLPKSNTQTGN